MKSSTHKKEKKNESKNQRKSRRRIQSSSERGWMKTKTNIKAGVDCGPGGDIQSACVIAG